MDSSTHDKRRMRGEQTRAGILQAAVALVAAQGVKEVSAAKLAAAAGVAKSAVFHHFPSVDDVLAGALRLVLDGMLRAAREAEAPDAERFLRRLGQAVLEPPDAGPDIFRAFLSFSHESMFNPAYRDMLAASAGQMHDLVCERLGRYASPAVGEAAIDAAASLVLPMVDGLAFHYLIDGDAGKCRRVWEQHAEHILRLLAPR